MNMWCHECCPKYVQLWTDFATFIYMLILVSLLFTTGLLAPDSFQRVGLKSSLPLGQYSNLTLMGKQIWSLTLRRVTTHCRGTVTSLYRQKIKCLGYVAWVWRKRQDSVLVFWLCFHSKTSEGSKLASQRFVCLGLLYLRMLNLTEEVWEWGSGKKKV